MLRERMRLLAAGFLAVLAGPAVAQMVPPMPQQGVVWQGNVPHAMPYPVPVPPQAMMAARPPMMMPAGPMMMPGAMPQMMPGAMMPAGPMMMPNGMPQMMPGAMPQGQVMMSAPPAGMPYGRPVQALPTSNSPQLYTKADTLPDDKQAAEPIKDGAALTKDSKCSACNDFGNPCKRWTVFGDAMWLKRNDSERVFLAQMNEGLTLTPLTELTTDSTDFGYAPGFRVGLAYHLDDRRSIELSYFGLNHWSESVVLPNPQTNIMFSPYLFSLFLSDLVGFDYNSNLHNVEINFRREVGNSRWQRAVLGGFRYVNLQEDFNLFTATPAALASESTSVETSNNLVGLQLGGEMARGLGQRASLALFGKAGLFMNFADQTSTNVSDQGLGPVTNLQAHADSVALASVVEVGIQARYQIRPNLLLRGGYEVLFLSGVALAPEQLGGLNQDIFTASINPRTGSTINDQGSMILHGPTVGLELSWGGR